MTLVALLLGASLVACSAGAGEPAATGQPPATSRPSGTGGDVRTGGPSASGSSGVQPLLARPFSVTVAVALAHPWSMTFLPDGRALVTQQPGTLVLFDPATAGVTPVPGVPTVVYAGQGGLGDVVLGPTFASDGGLYLSWVEAGEAGTAGAVVGRATLRLDGSPRLEGLSVIWRQEPKVSGAGHFGHRIAVAPDGRTIFVTSGERQKFDPAQDLGNNLGSIVRLDLDGSPAPGNPWADRGGVTAQIWSYGHRNPLGIAFDAAGNLWSSEMGPQGGDEVNLVLPGRNYGWPRVSNGSHYGGADIPDHAPGDGFQAPSVWWNPSISPSSLMVYSGALFPQWRGDAFVGALSGEALIRVHLDGTTAVLADVWKLGRRIREVEQGPEGSLWLLEDGADARILRLTPAVG